MRGILTSIRIRSGCQASQASRASTPSRASRISAPRGSRSRSSRVRFASWSSTTRIRLGPPPGEGDHLRCLLRRGGLRGLADLQGNLEAEQAALPLAAVHLQVSPHDPQEVPADPQAQPRAPSGVPVPTGSARTAGRDAPSPPPRSRGPCPPPPPAGSGRPRSRRESAPAGPPPPSRVNFTALPRRFSSTCRSFPSSATTHRGEGFVPLQQEGEPLGLRPGTEQPLRLLQEPREVEGPGDGGPPLPASILDISRTSSISSSRCSPARLRASRYSPLPRGEVRLPLQEPGEAEDHVHGGADLVGHVGQKDALGPVGRFGGLLGPLQLQLQELLLRDVLVHPVHMGGPTLVVPLHVADGPDPDGPTVHATPVGEGLVETVRSRPSTASK